MHLRFDHGRSRRDIVAVVHDPDARVVDLAAALDPGESGSAPRPRSITVDGRVPPPGQRLERAGIVPGALVRLVEPDGGPSVPEPPDRPGPPTEAVVAVTVVGGLRTGRRWLLAPGRHRVGRPRPGVSGSEPSVALDDPTVSVDHAVLTVAADGSVAVIDAGSRNGTWVGERPAATATPVPADVLVRCGASQLQVVPTDLLVGATRPIPPRRSGAQPFHRPPRPARSPSPDPVDPPVEPAVVASVSTVGVVSVVAPIVLGLVMVRLLGSWTYALFMLLSPVMLIGTAVEQRRRGRRTRRRELQRFTAALHSFTALVDGARHDALRRLEQRLPGPATAVARARTTSARLWERRANHDDGFLVSAGRGSVPWMPPVRGERRAFADPVRDALDERKVLLDAPVEVDLGPGAVVGVAGDRGATLAVARSLVIQAVTLHGPADLLLAVAVDDHPTDWDWTKWLPHTIDPAGDDRLLAAGADEVARLVADLVESATGDGAAGDDTAATVTSRGPRAGDRPLLLVVVDGDDLVAGGRAPIRPLLRGAAGPVAVIVVSADPDRLPAATSTIVQLDGPDGAGSVQRLDPPAVVADLHAAGLADADARDAAVRLAGLRDPECADPARLPTSVALLPLLGLDDPDGPALGARWRAGGADPAPTATIGVAEDGPVQIDLEADGPHALIAGITGSGKSELLRSLVASLAAGSAPAHVTFLLLDFKGGSAFEECAGLPHTVGVITDLDEHLAARALRCLEAEIRQRERALNRTGARDLHEYRASGAVEPLPRLVVVVDEFATLAAELPDFVTSLVGVAQRGRSLGIHLVLATQRPTGSVSADIQANTDLRIALRVQSAADSIDVLDLPDAARLPRRARGRAIVRLGPGQLVTMQAAMVTGSTDRDRGPIEVRPFRFGRPADTGASPSSAAAIGPGGDVGPRPNDLAALATAAREAFAASGASPPRRPWTDPLPEDLDVADLEPDFGLASGRAGAPIVTAGPRFAPVALGLADLPDEQRQAPAWWDPAAGGLLIVGIAGSGTSTAARTAVLAAAEHLGPGDLHVYVLDLGPGDHAGLAALPHVGAVVPAEDGERQRRTLALLSAELERRRAEPTWRAEAPRLLLVVDGLSGFVAALDGEPPGGGLDRLARLVADGPALGLATVLTADRPGAVPPSVSGLIRQRLVLRLSDRNDHGAFGIAPSAVPDLPPGRGHLAEGSVLVQVARPPDLAGTIERIRRRHPKPPLDRQPRPIGALPSSMDLSALLDVVEASVLADGCWTLPVGVRHRDLGPAWIRLHPHDHLLVAGPARSGRTTALRTLAAVAKANDRSVTVVAVVGGRSALAGDASVDRTVSVDGFDRSDVAAIGAPAGPVLVLVDDADRTDDDHRLAELLDLDRPSLHVVVAGQAEPLRQRFGHWTRRVRASRSGLLLQPDLDLDGDLLGCRLPRRPSTALGPGRGWLVTDGTPELVQLAHDERR